MNEKSWLFIVGPARSGTTLIASLLDGHKNLLVWPFEWRYFTEFHNRIADGAEYVESRKLLREFNRILERFQKKSFKTYYSSITMEGLVDHTVFSQCLGKIDECVLSAEDFLSFVFSCYSQSIQNKNRNYRYNVMKCMTKGFDWRNEDLIARAKFLYLKRPILLRYKSQRTKFIEKFGCGPVETFLRCRRLFLETKMSEEVYETFRHRKNFMVIDLNLLKDKPNVVMEEIASFLEIEFTPSLLQPTFLGKPFEGHFHDKKLNKGVILNIESAHASLTSYEMILLDSFAGEKFPNALKILNLMLTSVLCDLDHIFLAVTLYDRLKILLIFLEYLNDMKNYHKTTLINQSFFELKQRYPFITQFRSDYNISDVPM